MSQSIVNTNDSQQLVDHFFIIDGFKLINSWLQNTLASKSDAVYRNVLFQLRNSISYVEVINKLLTVISVYNRLGTSPTSVCRTDNATSFNDLR